MTVLVKQSTLEALQAHACETYPDECCGMIVERDGREEAVRVMNIQNELHATDPEQYPRTAAIAYMMGPESAPILLAAERGALTLRAFYHSHPEHDAYFSAEDKKQAMGGWDEPSYPQAAHIVMSVRARQVRATKAFAWDESAREFIEVVLRTG
jgi:[CysO sulfur-carrier protein]-S-L-cysteine hydrolase